MTNRLLNAVATASMRLTCALILSQVLVPVWSPAASATDVNDGVKAYGAKDYAGARLAFEKAVKANASDTVAQYYLGNTYVALGLMPQAKYAYQVCMHYSKDLATQNLCKAGIATVEQHQQKLRGLPASTTASAGATSGASGSVEPGTSATSKDKVDAKAGAKDKDGDDDEKEVEDNSPKAKIAKQKAEVMQKAREECSKIRKEVEDRIKNEAETTNGRVKHSDGTRGLGLLTVIADGYRKEAEERCEQIMNAAELRCRGFR